MAGARRWLTAGVAAASVLAGCVRAPVPATSGTAAATTTTAALIGREAERADAAVDGGFDVDSLVRDATVRVRNVSCLGVGVGSGVVLADGTVVTNRHVVDGAGQVEISTWDGEPIEARSWQVATGVDLAVVRTVPGDRSVLLAPANPEPGEEVTILGYPGGGPFESVPATVVELRSDATLGNLGTIMVLEGRIEPGSSGGPVVDAAGEVVGVIYGIEVATRRALAVPVSKVDELVDPQSLSDPVPHCP